MTKTLIQVNGLSRSFNLSGETVHALQNVDLSIHEKEIVLVEGKSGSGKTTLINLMGGLDTPTEGNVVFRNVDLSMFTAGQKTQWRRKTVGFVFQAFALIPGLSALENVDLAARLAGFSPKESLEHSIHFLTIVGLAKRMRHRISELSGGEQQRVAIARGFVGKPEIVFADEPTGELDHAMSRNVLTTIRELVDTTGMTVCLTSHDTAVQGYADRVYTLADGKLVEEKKN